jgi:hypothetical protein
MGILSTALFEPRDGPLSFATCLHIDLAPDSKTCSICACTNIKTGLMTIMFLIIPQKGKTKLKVITRISYMGQQFSHTVPMHK